MTKRVLIAPLDWGLGHASRCIPIVNELLLQGCEVVLGGSGISGRFFRNEFPQLTYVEIPGYDVQYSDRSSMTITMLRQAPSILQSIRNEKKWLRDFIEQHPIDAVISDHRYGLYHENTYSVFLGHQLFIQSGNALMDALLWKVNKGYIEKFSMCWIPDMPDTPNASGKLSHGQDIPFSHRYIGILSRLAISHRSGSVYDAAIILSGLEPLRTRLEELILSELTGLEGSYIMVRGTDWPFMSEVPSHITMLDLAGLKEMECILKDSAMVISRSGYSSIMDYMAAGIPALLIPTPGQTEQVYLADYQMESGNFYSIEQGELDLARDMRAAHQYVPAQLPNRLFLGEAVSEMISFLH